MFTVYDKRKKALGETQTFRNSEASGYEWADVDTEDAGFIMVRFSDGVYGNLVLSQVSGGYKNSMRFSIDCANYSLRWEQETPDRIVVGDRKAGEVKIRTMPTDIPHCRAGMLWDGQMPWLIT